MFPRAEINTSATMKLYLVLAIAVCQSCHHFARADLDSRRANPRSAPGSLAAGTDLWPSLVARGPPNDGELSWSGDSSELVGDWLWPMAVKRSAKADIQTRRRSALDKNFMRFGRAGSNLMRFGRPDRNFLRFGRTPEARDEETELSKEYATSTEQLEQRESDEGQQQPTVKRNAGNSEELLGGGVMMSDSGEQLKPKQVVYYRRDSPKNLMRFGKRRSAASGSGYLRFGRGNLMRFGRRSDEPGPRTVRAGPNMMRFGRASNLMRFGRSDRPPNETAVEGSGGAVNPTVARHDPLPVNLLELLEKLQPQDDRMLLQDALVESETESAPDDRLPLFVVEK
ncbi:FMRFamide-related peptides [Anopheles cruzii]|uniref:FMRFamide-related peptides n=1 Tax=Anopheles cruzii TaxID=68878 RepID=UPI0022EC54B7|nr:FMRFamide-related peptides [Anopheles cruzii]